MVCTEGKVGDSLFRETGLKVSAETLMRRGVGERRLRE